VTYPPSRPTISGRSGRGSWAQSRGQPSMEGELFVFQALGYRPGVMTDRGGVQRPAQGQQLGEQGWRRPRRRSTQANFGSPRTSEGWAGVGGLFLLTPRGRGGRPVPCAKTSEPVR
jgi:hypothetical protein